MELTKKHRVRLWLLLAVVIIAMLLPMQTAYKDGGTVKYQAVLYTVTKRHSMAQAEYGGGYRNGYQIGTEVRILFWEVYNDVEFVPDNIETTLSPAS